MIRLAPLQWATLAIAAAFTARAVLRLLQLEFNVLHFAVLGWPPWSVWAVSVAELVGVALLLSARSFLAGAAILAISAGAFVVTYAYAGAPQAGGGAAGLVLVLAVLAATRWRSR